MIRWSPATAYTCLFLIAISFLHGKSSAQDGGADQLPEPSAAEILGDPDQPRSTSQSEQSGLDLGSNTNPTEAAEVGDWKDPAEFIRSHWVRMTKDRQLVGRILTLDQQDRPVTPEDMTVEIFQDGQLKGKTVVVDGRFELSGSDPGGLAPGVYALIARSQDGFLAYGLQLLPPLEDPMADIGMSRLDSSIQLVQAIKPKSMLEIQSSAVPPTFEQLKRILKESFPKMRNQYVPKAAYDIELNQAESDEDPGFDEEAKVHRLRGTEELTQDDTPGENTLAATSIAMQPVYLDERNRMLGRLYGIDAKTGRPARIDNTTVYIIKNDREITTKEVDERGFFSLRLPRPGTYSLVAAGEDGFGAVSFRAVGIDEQDREVRYRRRYNEYIQLAQFGPFDQQDEFGDDGGAPRARPVPNAAGRNVFAAPFAMALISDPDVIRQAVSHWAAQPMAMGGMMDMGIGSGPMDAFAGSAPMASPPMLLVPRWADLPKAADSVATPGVDLEAAEAAAPVVACWQLAWSAVC